MTSSFAGRSAPLHSSFKAATSFARAVRAPLVPTAGKAIDRENALEVLGPLVFLRP